MYRHVFKKKLLKALNKMTKTFNKIKVKTENIKIKSNLKMSIKAGMQGENHCFPVSLKSF